MTITKITTQKKNSSRYSIYIDGEYSFSLSDLALLEAKIAVGQELSAEEVKRLQESSELDKFYQRILNLLSLRSRSEYEIRTYLKKHNCPTDQADIILNKLSEKKYINDLAFSISWIQNRQLLRPSSKTKLINELKIKGINKEIISQAFEETQPDEIESLKVIVEKKRKLTRFQDNQKLMQYLIRQGFHYSEIKNVLTDQAG